MKAYMYHGEDKQLQRESNHNGKGMDDCKDNDHYKTLDKDKIQ